MGYLDAAQQQRKLTSFGTSSATANLNKKVVKVELLFSGILAEQNLLLSTKDHAAQAIPFSWSHQENPYANWSSCKVNYQQPERGTNCCWLASME